MEDPSFVARLRDGDEAAFRQLINRHHRKLVGLARSFCGNQATAEEVVQDTWITVLTDLTAYSGAAPLPAWIAGIVVNKARQRAIRDGRMSPFSDLSIAGAAENGDDVDGGRFTADGGWRSPPLDWSSMTPEREVSGREMLAIVAEALDTLPAAQRAVILLSDVEACAASEVCQILNITEGNRRVLLHRGRARIRAAVEHRVARAPEPRPGNRRRDEIATGPRNNA